MYYVTAILCIHADTKNEAEKLAHDELQTICSDAINDAWVDHVEFGE